MALRQSTIRLSIEDAFSGPLAAYAAGMAQADAATAKTAAGAASASAATDQLAGAMTRTTTVEVELATAARNAGTAQQDQADKSISLKSSLLEVYAAVGLAQQGISMLSGAYKSVVGDTLAYSDSVRKLQRDIGATSEESSKLIYASNQVGVSADVLGRAFDQAINRMRNVRTAGIEPNIEGLGKLSDMYLAIQDPVLRTQFLLDNFGRAGANLAPLMALGSAGIKALGDQATATGTVLSTQSTSSLFQYEQEMNKLGASFLGVKIALTELALPALVAFGNWATDRVQTLTLFKQALDNGKLSFQDFATVVFNWLGNPLSGGSTVQLLNDRLSTNKQMTLDASVANSNYAISLANVGKASADVLNQGWGTGTWSIPITTLKNQFTALSGAALDLAVSQAQVSDASNKANDAWSALQSNTHPEKVDSLTTAWVNATAALEKARGAAQKLADAPLMNLLNAGLSGPISKAQDTYADTIAKTGAEMAKLQAQLDKYNAEQGQTVTVTGKGTVSQEDYQVAVDRAALALAKYNDALTATGKHKKDDLTIEGLRISAAAAANTVEDMSHKVANSSTVIVDNSTKIGDLNTKLSALQQQENDARAALEKTTASFILQQVVADTKLGPALELQLARNLGLIDEKSFKMGESILTASGKLHIGADGLVKDDSAWQTFLKTVVGIDNAALGAAGDIPKLTPPLMSTRDRLTETKDAALAAAGGLSGPLGVSAAVYSVIGVLPQLDQSIKNPRDRLAEMRDAALNARDALLSIPATVNTQVNTYYHRYGSQDNDPNAGNHAAGTDMVVPHGFAGDSYNMRVQSGERVIVIPAGNPGNGGPGAPGARLGGGGDTVIINDKLAAALYLESRRQNRLSMMEKAL